MTAPIELRLQWRAIVLLLALVLCFLVTGLLVLRAQEAASGAAGRADRLRRVQLDVDDLLIGMVNQETGIRGYGDTRNASFLEPYTLGGGQVATAVRRLQGEQPPGVQRALGATIAAATSWQRWAASRRVVIESRSGPVVDPSALLDGKRLFDAFRGAQADLESTLGRAVSSAVDEMSGRSREARQTLLLGGLVSAVLLSVAGLLLVRGILRPIVRLAHAADAIAAGDEVAVLPARRHDELGALTQALARWRSASIEERRDRQALREQAQLIELAHDAIIVRELSGARIRHWSRGAEETYGWSRGEALGRVSHELLETRFPQPLQEIEEQVLRTGRWQGELGHRRRDGGLIVVDSRWALLAGAAGAPAAALEVNRDVTERKRLEENLKTSRDELARASHAKNDFLSRMSHELRTPLNAILGFAQLLELDVEARDREFVQRIGRAGRHLLDLVNDILDISRVESGATNLSIEAVAVAGAVEEAVELIRPLAAARQIEVTTHVAPGMTGRHALADLQRIKQVLLNLLSNAVKYNRDRGSVSVEVAPRGARVRVAVSDTGPGIPAQMMHRLFEPFDRLDAELTGVEGTGLGLALSRQLLTAMGGSISVTSSDRGSTFSVDLPAVEAPGVGQDVAPAGCRQDHARDARARTVLYVEDNLSNLQLVTHILERRGGVVVLPAMQGGLALDLARQHCPDLILLDLHLPDLSGYDVFCRLRAEKRTACIPVVVISADTSRGQIDRLIGAGARAHLTKPLQVSEFLAVFDEVLEGSSRG
jgi:PAS domain S-box-containing protein